MAALWQSGQAMRDALIDEVATLSASDQAVRDDSRHFLQQLLAEELGKLDVRVAADEAPIKWRQRSLKDAVRPLALRVAEIDAQLGKLEVHSRDCPNRPNP